MKRNICFLFKISYKGKKGSVSGEKYCGLDIPVAAASDDGNTTTLQTANSANTASPLQL